MSFLILANKVAAKITTESLTFVCEKICNVSNISSIVIFLSCLLNVGSHKNSNNSSDWLKFPHEKRNNFCLSYHLRNFFPLNFAKRNIFLLLQITIPRVTTRREVFRKSDSGALSFGYASYLNAYLGILSVFSHTCTDWGGDWKRGLSNVRAYVRDSVRRDSHLSVLVCAVSHLCVCAWRTAGSRRAGSTRSFQRVRATSPFVRKRRLSADRESRLGRFPRRREQLIAPPSAIYTGRIRAVSSDGVHDFSFRQFFPGHLRDYTLFWEPRQKSAD